MTMAAKQRFVVFAIFLFQAVALTDIEEGIYLVTLLVDLSIHCYLCDCDCDCDFAVEALRNFYRSLNCPTQLNNWKLEGGDPCDELWTGVSCHQSSVIDMYKSSSSSSFLPMPTPLWFTDFYFPAVNFKD